MSYDNKNDEMVMNEKKDAGKGLLTAILSLSLLTVMAGAAVAPALGTMRDHFSEAGGTTVQLIISMPALFIFLSSFVFPHLCRRFSSRTIVIAGLALYVAGGCGAALFDNIAIVLIFRALVGCGVGLIMPMSTGLLSYYYPPQQLDRLMGLSSAMNQMGGAVATFIAGILSTMSWRAAFLVYLMGLISLVPCLMFLPADRIGDSGDSEQGNKKAEGADGNVRDSKEKISGHPAEKRNGSDADASPLKKYFVYVAAMFILMSTFFLYPSNYAIESMADGYLSQEGISTVMALMDVVAFAGGLCYVRIRGALGSSAHFTAPALFAAGYLLMAFAPGAVLSIIGSFLVGFANGAGIPCIIAAASHKAGKAAVSTVMPLLTAAMYIAQFLSPFIMSAVTAIVGAETFRHLPFIWGVVLAVILVILAYLMKRSETTQA